MRETFFGHSSANATAAVVILVPTVPVGMPSFTLCVVGGGAQTRERRGLHSHAEHGNEVTSLIRLGLRQRPRSVE
jgi:hypothetical protein